MCQEEQVQFIGALYQNLKLDNIYFFNETHWFVPLKHYFVKTDIMMRLFYRFNTYF